VRGSTLAITSATYAGGRTTRRRLPFVTMWPVPTDFEAEGLLEGLESDRARSARLELLRTLEQEGFQLEELRQATEQAHLALLPVELVLAGEGPLMTQRQLTQETGLELEFQTEARRAIGLPAAGPDEPVVGADEAELARAAAILLDAGLDREGFLEMTRVMSQAMASVAAAITSTLGAAMLRPGDTEQDVGLRYAGTMRNLGPLAGPSLTHMLNLRMREQIRQAVVGQAELQSGRLPGAQWIAVGFVDIVGFTELGEEIPPEQLGGLIRDFERTVEDGVRPPVRLVKTIGDAALLVAPETVPVVDAVVELVERSGQSDDRPLLRGGVASGEALPRAGDWYGRPVNLAARLTAFARRGSVVASKPVRDAAADRYRWSFAGSRRFRGVAGETEVYRARPKAA